MKKTVLKAVKFVIVLIITMAVSAAVRVLGSIINGEHGAPSFVTPAFQVFGFVTNILFLGSYVLLEKYIPIKNKILRGLLFILLFWSSDYISQVLGMSGAASPIIKTDALSASTIIIDSLHYAFCGVVMGLLLSSTQTAEKRKCDKKRFIAASLASMVVFAAIQAILEFVVSLVNPEYSCVGAFQIAESQRVNFYLVFYAFQAVSGLLIAVFYRYSMFNSDKSHRALRFGAIYGLMLWTPVVLIMVFFGAALPVTIIFAINMLIALFADTFIFTKIMNRQQSTTFATV